MNVDAMVRATLRGLEHDIYEIRPGVSNVLKFMSRYAPSFMLKQINRSVVKELAGTR